MIRLRSRIAKLEAKLEGGELRSRPREQQITVAHRMQSAGATKGAADLVPADGFADMVHDNESGAGGIAQAQQRLAQGGHGAGIVFILIVRGVERVENQDLSGSGSRCGNKVIQTLRGAEQMA